MDENNILFENQFGFRKQISTVHALIQINEQIRSAIENGKYGCGIFIDLRKAFDTVNHVNLLGKWNIMEFEEWLFNGLSLTLQTESNMFTLMGMPISRKFSNLIYLLMNIYYEADNLKKLERIINKELVA